MLTFNHRTIAKEATVANRALELFLSVHGLAWADAYSLAAFERTVPPERFQQALEWISQGQTLKQATALVHPAMPISDDIEDIAWQARTWVPR